MFGLSETAPHTIALNRCLPASAFSIAAPPGARDPISVKRLSNLREDWGKPDSAKEKRVPSPLSLGSILVCLRGELNFGAGHSNLVFAVAVEVAGANLGLPVSIPVS